jgi:hypothetical protein
MCKENIKKGMKKIPLRCSEIESMCFLCPHYNTNHRVRIIIVCECEGKANSTMLHRNQNSCTIKRETP